MSPNRESAWRHSSPLISDWARAISIAKGFALNPSAGAIAAMALPCRRCRRVIAKCRIPVAEEVLLRTQYKARVRQFTLLFPHVNRRGTALLRRNVPITTRSAYGNGQAMPGRRVGSEVHAGLSKCYFAAVGSGTG